MNTKNAKDLVRYLCCLLALGLTFGGYGYANLAMAQDLSFRLIMPSRGVPESSNLKRMIETSLRQQLMRKGFFIKPTGSIKVGYHLEIAASTVEEFQPDSPATCDIQLETQLIILPEKRLVMRLSSSGSSRFSRPAKFSTKRRRELRQTAVSKAMGYFSGKLRGHISEVDERKRSLGKDVILGQKWRGGITSGQPKSLEGRALPGPPPLYKILPAAFDAHRHRPPM